MSISAGRIGQPGPSWTPAAWGTTIGPCSALNIAQGPHSHAVMDIILCTILRVCQLLCLPGGHELQSRCSLVYRLSIRGSLHVNSEKDVVRWRVVILLRWRVDQKLLL